jgi:hypothetical protein
MSLARLRDLGQDNPGVRTRDHNQEIAEYSYCCVEKERPRKAIYLYRKFKSPYYANDSKWTTSAQCSDEKFQRVKDKSLSETSTLNRQLSPLLESPIDTDSIIRSPEGIRLIHLGADSGPKCLEFITLYNPKRL